MRAVFTTSCIVMLMSIIPLAAMSCSASAEGLGEAESWIVLEILPLEKPESRVAKPVLEFLILGLYLLSTGITVLCHHTWLISVIYCHCRFLWRNHYRASALSIISS